MHDVAVHLRHHSRRQFDAAKRFILARPDMCQRLKLRAVVQLRSGGRLIKSLAIEFRHAALLDRGKIKRRRLAAFGFRPHASGDVLRPVRRVLRDRALDDEGVFVRLAGDLHQRHLIPCRQDAAAMDFEFFDEHRLFQVQFTASGQRHLHIACTREDEVLPYAVILQPGQHVFVQRSFPRGVDVLQRQFEQRIELRTRPQLRRIRGLMPEVLLLPRILRQANR